MTSELDGGFNAFLKSVPFDQIGNYYKQAVDYGIVDLTLHPFDYADILIRLGYEPFLPVEAEPSIFRNKKSLVLPGIVNYVGYLHSIDGVPGLYRAAFPYISGNLIYRHFSASVMNHSPFSNQLPEGEPRLCEKFTNANIGHFVRTRAWALLSNLVAIHAAYPFHTIAIRTMARFVTTATASEGYRPEIIETWIDEVRRVKGIPELYAGCQAQLFKEITLAVIAAGSFLALMKVAQLFRADPQKADSLEHSLNFVANTIAALYMNPFRNVADIMTINSTDIPLGNPPFNERFFSCWDCFMNLRKERKWKTSSSGLFQFGRYYNGPMEMDSNGRLFPRGTMFGPLYFPREARGMDDLPYFLRGYYAAWNQMKEMFESGQFGLGDPFLKESFGKQTRSGSVVLSGIKPKPMLSERVSMDILGSSSKTFYFKGPSSSNPFGL